MHIPTTILKTLSTNQRKGLEARLTGDLRVKDGDTQTAQLVMDIMRERHLAWCAAHEDWHIYDVSTWRYIGELYQHCPPPPRTATEWHEPTAPTAEGPGGTSADDTTTAEQRIEKHFAGHNESKNSVKVLQAKEALRKDGTLPVDMEQPDLDESMAPGDLSSKNLDKPNCGVTHGQYTCTLKKDHTGDHIAHWSDGKKAQRWQGPDERTAREGAEYCNHAGPIFTCTRPKGHKGDHIGHVFDGKEVGRWPQEGPPPPVKKWKKKLFNRCPQCSMDTLNTELQSPPEPVDETERIEYTERPCGCEVLKAIGIA